MYLLYITWDIQINRIYTYMNIYLSYTDMSWTYLYHMYVIYTDNMFILIIHDI